MEELNDTYNDIYFFTHKHYCRELTSDIINIWRESSNLYSKLNIVDLDAMSIMDINKNGDLYQDKQDIDRPRIEELIDKYNVLSYPYFCIVRNDMCVEGIYGNYNNILNIIKYYF